MEENKLTEVNEKDKAWLASIAGIMLVVVLVYFNQFGFDQLSNNQEVWGQFGDFIGGILNPVVAFAAFYYLWTSVRIQRKELAASTKALTENVTEQRELAKINKTAAHVQILTTRLNTIDSEIAQMRDAQIHNKPQFHSAKPGHGHYPSANEQIGALLSRRKQILSKLLALETRVIS